MAIKASTKADRVRRLEARIEKIKSHKAGLTKRIASLSEDEAAAKAELEWVKSAPTSDGAQGELALEPDEPQVYEPTAVRAASPAENAGVAEVATATQHL